MTDIERQRRAQQPDVPLNGGGQIPVLTGLQRELAFFADEMAEALLPMIDQGKTWFTAYDIRQKPEFLTSYVTAGLLTKHKSAKHDGHYFKCVPLLTRVMLLAALALRDERRKAMKSSPGPTNGEDQ